MIHSVYKNEVIDDIVVNCFQFINFVNDSQFDNTYMWDEPSCELLSVH